MCFLSQPVDSFGYEYRSRTFYKQQLKPVTWQVSVVTVTGEQLLNLSKYAVFNLKISCYTGWNTPCCYCGLSAWLPSCRPLTICRCCSVSGFMFTKFCGVVGGNSGMQTEGTRSESRLQKRLSCIRSTGKIPYSCFNLGHWIFSSKYNFRRNVKYS